jgi:hypothetical protein
VRLRSCLSSAARTLRTSGEIFFSHERSSSLLSKYSTAHQRRSRLARIRRLLSLSGLRVIHASGSLDVHANVR